LSLALAVAGTLALAPIGVLAGSATETFLLVAEAPNVGVAANGETIEITCTGGEVEHVCGSFGVHPKSIEASGEFAHFLADGSLFASGTWTATKLISYQSYGCGVVLGDPLPPEACGGKLKFAATFSTPMGELDGIITVFCIVGPRRRPATTSHRVRASRWWCRGSSTSTTRVAARPSTSRPARADHAAGAWLQGRPPPNRSYKVYLSTMNSVRLASTPGAGGTALK